MKLDRFNNRIDRLFDKLEKRPAFALLILILTYILIFIKGWIPR